MSKERRNIVEKVKNTLEQLRQLFSKPTPPTPTRSQLEEMAYQYFIPYKDGLDSGSIVVPGEDINVTLSYSVNKKKEDKKKTK